MSELDTAKAGICVPRSENYRFVIASSFRNTLREQAATKFHEAQYIASMFVQEAFDRGEEEETTVTISLDESLPAVYFDGKVLIAYRDHMAKKFPRSEEKPPLSNPPSRREEWNQALEWARMHGAKMRRGRITRDLAIERIADADLDEKWNARWPQFAFSPEDLALAKVRNQKRREYYKKKQPTEEADRCIGRASTSPRRATSSISASAGAGISTSTRRRRRRRPRSLGWRFREPR